MTKNGNNSTAKPRGLDTPLAAFGRVLSSIPASQASAERVFNTADFLANGRGRLSFDHLLQAKMNVLYFS